MTSERPSPGTDPTWWRSAVIYQIYPRSFADGNGDGTGDLAGLRARLPYLRDLGVDAVWVTPWYRSPLADGGYDVADYRAIDPAFGTLEEAEAVIAEALGYGIRTIIDIVPNHVSDQHPWFRAALAAGPGSAERERFWFRPGRGEHGEGMPTGWVSEFQGDTWTRITEPDGTPGEWYLHLFTPAQPDLNWSHPDVRAEFSEVLRFWFDRGVAGIRIDSAALLVKDPAAARVLAGLGLGRPSACGSRRDPRDLPVVAIAGGLLSGHPDPGRGGLAGRPAAVRPLPTPRRDAHGLQLRLHGATVAGSCTAGDPSRRRWRPMRRWTRRPPGCCPTTTSPGR